MAQSTAKAAWARGGTLFAATVMLVIGIFQIFEGIAAIAKDQFFVVGSNYAYKIDTTAWGWIHLGLGILVAITGFFLFAAMTWARVVGIGLAVISATANFFFVPYYPLWSLLIIALNIFVIWALATGPSRAELTEAAEARAMAGGYSGEYMQDTERWATTNPPPSGRHYAGEPAKETGTRAPASEMPQRDAMAQPGMDQPGMGQPGTGQPGTGQRPPTSPSGS